MTLCYCLRRSQPTNGQVRRVPSSNERPRQTNLAQLILKWHLLPSPRNSRSPRWNQHYIFIPQSAVLKGRKITYGKKECTIRPNKTETHRVQLTVGGDKLPCEGIIATHCASLTTAKLLMNSTISTQGVKFSCVDIKNMYYGTPMTAYEYMKIKLSEIPQDIMKHYNLDKFFHTKGYVYLEIRKGMPGLKQAGQIENKRQVKHLNKSGYKPCPHTPALWKHKSNWVVFALVVDNFGVKYSREENFKHLLSALRILYEITVNYQGSKFLGLLIDWDYENGTVDISMPKYIEKVLTRCQHIACGQRQHSPHKWKAPTFWQKTQYATDNNTIPASTDATKHVQQGVDPYCTMHVHWISPC